MYNRKNIFVDFLNPDFRRQYGWERNPKSKNSEIQTVVHLLNISILLCREFCVAPPGFIFLSEVSFMAISKCKTYLLEGYLKLPIKENNIEDLVQKKKKQYQLHWEKYDFIYQKNIKDLFFLMDTALIERKSNVGESISKLWLEGPDLDHSIWKEVKKGSSINEISQLRNIPSILIDKNIACTKPAIKSLLLSKNPKIDIDIYKLIHNSHTQVYIDEYDLSVLKNIPYFRYDLNPIQNNFLYDYDIFTKIFKYMNLWKIILDLSPEECIQIKKDKRFRKLLKLFETEEIHKLDNYEVQDVISNVIHRISDSITLFHSKYIKKNIISNIFFSKEKKFKNIEYLCCLINSFSDVFNEEIFKSTKKDIKKEKNSMKFKDFLNKNNIKHIAFFAALNSEVDIIKTRWNLHSDSNNLSFSRKIDNGLISLFSPFDMGRVSAAISTMQFLHYCSNENKYPDLIIIIGIAGGFKKQNVSKGDVLIATDIIDISSRKIKGDKEPTTEFRPKSFETDSSLINQVNFELDKVSWGTKVVLKEEWDKDDGKYPVIHNGPIASADEVVGNKEWTDHIFSNNPKILGIEMEAGGVCAAARTFNIPVGVIRGVSDLADPSKVDDIWRKRAMKTIANLLEELIFI